MHGLIKGLGQLVRPVAPQPRIARVPHNGEEPDLAVVAMKAVKEAQRAQIRFLHQVFGIVLVVRQPTGQVVRGIQMRQEQLLVPCLPACLCQAVFLVN